MKKYGCITAAFAVLLCLLMTGCTNKSGKAEEEYYVREAEKRLYGEFSAGEELSGMSTELCLIEPGRTDDEDYLEVSAAGLFCESDREVLYVKEPYGKIYPASMTKCMTALLTLENCGRLEDFVEVGEEVSYGLDQNSSEAGLKEGLTLTVRDLLTALLVPSGNDAANVLAVYVGGSVSGFVEMMNEKASELGMLNTHYMNPHGLHHKDHYTSTYDMYLLLRACMSHPEFCEIAGTDRAEISLIQPNGTIEKQEYVSANSYLRGFTVPPAGLEVICAKTGYTSQAGRCLVMATKSADGKVYISVTAKAATYDDLYLQHNRLLELVGREG